METKVNYTFIGLFVLILGACAIVIPLWLGAGSSARNYGRYVVYMGESVSGLNKDAPVKYRGVEVGRVSGIELDPDNPARIRLILDIARGTPIREDTIATLETQGITGIAYINLSGKSRESPMVEPGNREPYPEIPSGHSLFFRLETEISRLLASLSGASAGIQAVFSEENQLRIRQSLASLDQLLSALAEQSATMTTASQAAAHILEQGAATSDQLPQLVEKLGKSSDGLLLMADEIRRQSREIGTAALAGTTQLNQVVEDSGQQLRLVSIDLQRLIQRLEYLAGQLEEHPESLLFGAPAPPPGPGEQEVTR